MTTTTTYGTWCNRINTYSTSPDADVVDYLNGGDNHWQTLVEKSGALDEMTSAYRAAISAALPPSISLCGDEFVGPWQPADDEFDGYPVDEDGALDLKAMIEDIDLDPIVEWHDPLTLEDIGRWELKSQAANPAKAASAAMARLKLKPFAHVPHPESGRIQSIYLAGPVREALKARPGKGVGGGRKPSTDA